MSIPVMAKIVERVMSILNLAIMNVSLDRKKTFSRLSNLSEVRQVIDCNPAVGEAYSQPEYRHIFTLVELQRDLKNFIKATILLNFFIEINFVL